MYTLTKEEKKTDTEVKIILNNFFMTQYMKEHPAEGRDRECPFCGKMHFQMRTRKDGWFNGKITGTCFAAQCPRCMEEVDAFTIVLHQHPEFRDFQDSRSFLTRAFEEAQINGEVDFDSLPVIEIGEPEPPEKPVDLTEWFKEKRNDLKKSYEYLKNQGQNRGISLETFLAANVGYDRHYQRPDQIAKGSKGFKPAFIFPVSNHAYTHVDSRLMDELDRLDKRYPGIKEFRRAKVGSPARAFNFDNAMTSEADYVFVTEGGFDCLSVLEAGFNALSIESSDNYQNFFDDIDLLLTYEKPGTDKTFLLICDNDEDGSLINNYLDVELNKRGLKAVIVDNSLDGCKDPNEFLTRYGLEALKDYLNEVLEKALKTDDQSKETAILPESGAAWEDSNPSQDKEPDTSGGRFDEEEEYFLQEEAAFHDHALALHELQQRKEQGLVENIKALIEIYEGEGNSAYNLYKHIDYLIHSENEEFEIDNPLFALIWDCCSYYHEDATEDETQYL